MFFSNDLLRGKGPLGNLWYAAWRVHKLRKQAILDFKIADGVKALEQPEQPLALRLEAHLLCGISKMQLRKCEIFAEDTKAAYSRLPSSFTYLMWGFPRHHNFLCSTVLSSPTLL